MGSLKKRSYDCGLAWYEQVSAADSSLREGHFVDSVCPGQTKADSLMNSLHFLNGIQSNSFDKVLFKNYEKDNWPRIVEWSVAQMDEQRKRAGDDCLDSDLVTTGSLFAVANYLKRPVIVLPVHMPRCPTMSLHKIVGIYLPMFHRPSDCEKSPMLLAYDSGTFSVIICERAPKWQMIYTPLVIRSHLCLPIRMVKADVEGRWHEELLNSYLDTYWIKNTSSRHMFQACSALAETQPFNRLVLRTFGELSRYHLFSCIPSPPKRDVKKQSLIEQKPDTTSDDRNNGYVSNLLPLSPLRKCSRTLCHRYAADGLYGFCVVCAEENVTCLSPFPVARAPSEYSDSESHEYDDDERHTPDAIPNYKSKYADPKKADDVSSSPELNLIENDFEIDIPLPKDGSNSSRGGDNTELQVQGRLCKNVSCSNLGVDPCKGYCHECIRTYKYSPDDFSEMYDFRSTHSIENTDVNYSDNAGSTGDRNEPQSSRKRTRKRSGRDESDQKRTPLPIIPLDMNVCANVGCCNQQAPGDTPYCHNCLQQGRVSQSVHSELYSFKEDKLLDDPDGFNACASSDELCFVMNHFGEE